ncbi:MAG: hypothetical protein V7642_1764 [Burkholderiales bacterium]|jgi:hypothetical protein
MAGPTSVTGNHGDYPRPEDLDSDFGGFHQERADRYHMPGEWPAGDGAAHGASGGFDADGLASRAGRFLGRTGAAADILTSLGTLYKAAKPLVEGAIASNRSGESVSPHALIEMADGIRPQLSDFWKQFRGGIKTLQKAQMKKEMDPVYQAEKKAKDLRRQAWAYEMVQGAKSILSIVRSGSQ